MDDLDRITIEPGKMGGQPWNSRTLLSGVTIGIVVTGVPSMMVAASGSGGVLADDERQVLLVIGILWAVTVAIAAFASRVPIELRRKEYGVRQTGR